MGITCGIDWAEAHHDVALADDTGQIVARARINTSATGFNVILRLIAENGGAQGEIPIAIETDKNLLPNLKHRAAPRFLPRSATNQHDSNVLPGFGSSRAPHRSPGRLRYVKARKVRNRRLGDACHWWAFATLAKSPGARAHYDRRRAVGDRHNAALRNLANKLLGRLWWCLQRDEPWDDRAPSRALGAGQVGGYRSTRPSSAPRRYQASASDLRATVSGDQLESAAVRMILVMVRSFRCAAMRPFEAQERSDSPSSGNPRTRGA
ncbi:hypothetical protein [Rhodococcus koreensis]